MTPIEQSKRSDPAMGAPTEPSRPNRPWLRRGVMAVLVVVAVSGAVMFGLSRFLDPVALADWLQPRLTTVLERDVTIGTADVRLLPIGFRLTDIEVADPTGLSPLLARASAVDMRVRLVPLLTRRLVVDRITLDAPSLDLRVGADNVSNFSTPSEARDDPPRADRPFALDLRSIRLTGGQVSYANALDSATLMVRDVEATSAVRRTADGPWFFQGVTGAGLSYSGRNNVAVGPMPVELTFDLDATPDLQSVSVRNGELRIDRVAFTVSGQLSDLAQPVRTADLAVTVADLPLATALEGAPEWFGENFGEVGGVLAADLAIVGGFGADARPAVSGRVTLIDGRIEGSEGASLADGLRATFGLESDGSITPQIEGEILGGATTLGGRVVFGDERIARLTLEANPDLARLSSLTVLPEGVTIAGRVAANLRIEIPLDSIATSLAEGDVTITSGRIDTPGLGVPIGVPNATARLDRNRVTLREQELDLGRERFVVTAELRDPVTLADGNRTPYLEATIRGPRLSLASLSPAPPADTALTYGRVAIARLGERPVGGISADQGAIALRLARPATLPLGGRASIAIDTLVDRRGRSEDFRAEVEFGPTFVRVSDARYRRYGGRLEGGFNLSLGPNVAQPFTMRMRAEGVDATTFLGSTTPLGRAFRGTLDFEADVSGALDEVLLPMRPALVGGGSFAMTGGGLRATPVTERIATFLSNEELREPTIGDWRTPFVLRDGGVHLAEAALAGTPGSPRVGGSVGLDGGLDLTAVFDLPRARLDSATVRRLGGAGALAAAALGRGDLTRANLHLSGTMTAPQVRATPSVSVAPVVDEIREEASREIRDAIQERRDTLENRASGYLRDLLRRRTAPPPPDTLRPDTLAVRPRPDTIG